MKYNKRAGELEGFTITQGNAPTPTKNLLEITAYLSNVDAQIKTYQETLQQESKNINFPDLSKKVNNTITNIKQYLRLNPYADQTQINTRLNRLSEISRIILSILADFFMDRRLFASAEKRYIEATKLQEVIIKFKYPNSDSQQGNEYLEDLSILADMYYNLGDCAVALNYANARKHYTSALKHYTKIKTTYENMNVSKDMDLLKKYDLDIKITEETINSLPPEKSTSKKRSPPGPEDIIDAIVEEPQDKRLKPNLPSTSMENNPSPAPSDFTAMFEIQTHSINLSSPANNNQIQTIADLKKRKDELSHELDKQKTHCTEQINLLLTNHNQAFKHIFKLKKAAPSMIDENRATQLKNELDNISLSLNQNTHSLPALKKIFFTLKIMQPEITTLMNQLLNAAKMTELKKDISRLIENNNQLARDVETITGTSLGISIPEFSTSADIPQLQTIRDKLEKEHQELTQKYQEALAEKSSLEAEIANMEAELNSIQP